MNTNEHGFNQAALRKAGKQERMAADRSISFFPAFLSGLLICVYLCSSVGLLPAHAQVLEGEWVSQADERIAQHRQAPVRIIVMGQDGKPAAGAKVHVQQLRRDFAVGFVVGGAGLDGIPWDAPAWRCFNAVALDRLTSWPAVQPRPGEWAFEPVENVVTAARRRGMTIRWGGLISADPGRVPPWVAELTGEALADAAAAHLNAVMDRFGLRIGQFDLYTHLLDHDLLGTAAVRRLYERGKALSPRAAMCLRFEDTLTRTRVQDMIERIMAARRAMIPFDRISLEQRVGGVLLQAPLARTFDVIGGLGLDVTLGSIEIGGASEAAAAINLETFLRTAFADPSVTGIYFSGVTAQDLVSPNAALVDEFGAPTDAGELLDGLFHGLWWTDADYVADELGNVYARVFAGSHRVSAALADGTQIEMTVHVPPPSPQRDARVILLEPLEPGRSPG